MPLLRCWAFVNVVAMAAFATTAILRKAPDKIAAEPDLLGLLAVPVIVSAAVWLGLACVRHWALTRA
jgi:hypothetical protein